MSKTRPVLKDKPPYADLEQVGRWSWHIHIYHGVMKWGPEGTFFTYFGSDKGARKKAERLLSKYIRKELRITAPRIRITSDEYERGVFTNEALRELRDPELSWDREMNRLTSG